MYSAEIEAMSDIVVQVVDTEVIGYKHRFGSLDEAAEAIADAMEGHPPKELFSPESAKFPLTPSVQEIVHNRVEQIFEEHCREIEQAEPIPVAVEESDRWVVQDRESVRTWCDQVRWSTWPPGYWEKATHEVENFRHGHDYGDAVLSVRCLEQHISQLTIMVLHREPRPFEELPSRPVNEGFCVSLRVPFSGDEVTDNLIRDAVRRDIAVAFASGSLAFAPKDMGRSDWQDSQQLADLPSTAVAFADDMMKQLGFSK